METLRGTLVITGASRGIGAATARLAASNGYAVAVNFATARAEAEAVARDIVLAGGIARAIGGDVSREADVLALFAEAHETLGPIVGLVNNAGVTGGSARVVEVSADQLERTLAVNVIGSFLCAREAVRRMAHSRGGVGGAIVNVSSIAARLGGAGEWVHYAASKGAIDSFTRGLAIEVAADGIRVNAVSPGLIETDIHATSSIPDRLATLAPTVPMRRAGTPEEVAETILWLLSENASYVSGTIVDVGGGR
jgi:NAD(P)-dependent dehydrogenase (short-subunit alcohol dehydrogenase family)